MHVNKWIYTEFSVTADGNGDWYNPCKAPFETYVDPNIRSQPQNQKQLKSRMDNYNGVYSYNGIVFGMERE